MREPRTGDVLVSWVGRNDPYGERDGQRSEGPTLTLLFDRDSEYRDCIREAVLLYRRDERRSFDGTRVVLRERAPALRVEGRPWNGTDPTDHKEIFEFLREQIPEIRRRHAGRRLVVHVSPGTPSMQTVWVLMAECGFIDPPFVAVKSYRPEDRRPGGPATAEVGLGMETFYKRYQEARPRAVAPEEGRIDFDPKRFRSPALKELYREAARLAGLAVPILLQGERGTGKTALASWIRMNSPFRRRDKDRSWPSVVCGQYSPETMRAELFGHPKGAFTGAERDHPGLLAAAHGDTLFLDEIGDISRDLQRLLIRVLEDRTYQRLNETEVRKSDFRLLTATNLPEDRLRERLDPDFYDRVAPLRLRLPPLRELREDLDWLWDAVLTQAARRARARPPVLPEAERGRIVEALRAHRLLGNLRDLFRVAYQLLGALAEPDPLPPREAVASALASLGEQVEEDPHRAVAGCFAQGEGLDALVQPGRQLKTRDLFRALRGYLGRELRRLGDRWQVPPAELCDQSNRNLLDWAKSGGGDRIEQTCPSRESMNPGVGWPEGRIPRGFREKVPPRDPPPTAQPRRHRR